MVWIRACICGQACTPACRTPETHGERSRWHYFLLSYRILEKLGYKREMDFILWKQKWLTTEKSD